MSANSFLASAPGGIGSACEASTMTYQGGVLLLVWSSHDFNAAVGTDDDFLFGECDGFGTRSSSRGGLVLRAEV